MSTFHLKISTPDGLKFDGEVERLRVRMIDGDVSLLARHADYVSAVGAGEAAILTADGQTRCAACIGGMVSVVDGAVTLVPTTFEWAEDIDVDWAKRSAQDAIRRKENSKEQQELVFAEMKLKRAMNRLRVSSMKE